MPAAPITFLHFSFSALMKLSNSAGDVLLTSAFNAVMRSNTAGVRSASANRALSNATIDAGVFAGALNPNQIE